MNKDPKNFLTWNWSFGEMQLSSTSHFNQRKFLPLVVIYKVSSWPFHLLLLSQDLFSLKNILYLFKKHNQQYS